MEKMRLPLIEHEIKRHIRKILLFHKSSNFRFPYGKSEDFFFIFHSFV
jgi:hypothetical protein